MLYLVFVRREKTSSAQMDRMKRCVEVNQGF